MTSSVIYNIDLFAYHKTQLLNIDKSKQMKSRGMSNERFAKILKTDYLK